jgi:hypothetical protein
LICFFYQKLKIAGIVLNTELGLQHTVLVELGSNQLLDAVCGIEQLADALVNVKSGDHKSNVLAHIDLGVPGSLAKLGSTVDEVGGEDLADNAVLVCAVELLESVAEETEGSEYEYSLSTSGLQLSCNVENGLTGGNDFARAAAAAQVAAGQAQAATGQAVSAQSHGGVQVQTLGGAQALVQEEEH